MHVIAYGSPAMSPSTTPTWLSVCHGMQGQFWQAEEPAGLESPQGILIMCYGRLWHLTHTSDGLLVMALRYPWMETLSTCQPTLHLFSCPPWQFMLSTRSFGSLPCVCHYGLASGLT